MSRIRLSKAQKLTVIKRANGHCEYCCSPANVSVSPFTIEHIVPIIAGGQTVLENLAFACGGCNGYKYDKTEGIDPATGEFTSLYHPRQYNWFDHFGWSKDYLEVVGLTSIGRSTIQTLRLNRPELQNLRQILFAVGLHPPS
jgi:hypothetical protein